VDPIFVHARAKADAVPAVSLLFNAEQKAPNADCRNGGINPNSNPNPDLKFLTITILVLTQLIPCPDYPNPKPYP